MEKLNIMKQQVEVSQIKETSSIKSNFQREFIKSDDDSEENLVQEQESVKNYQDNLGNTEVVFKNQLINLKLNISTNYQLVSKKKVIVLLKKIHSDLIVLSNEKNNSPIIFNDDIEVIQIQSQPVKTLGLPEPTGDYSEYITNLLKVFD